MFWKPYFVMPPPRGPKGRGVGPIGPKAGEGICIFALIQLLLFKFAYTNTTFGSHILRQLKLKINYICCTVLYCNINIISI